MMSGITLAILICVSAASGIIFGAEPDLKQKSYAHRRQLSKTIKRGHRRFVSLMRPPTFPEVFDSNRVRTSSEFNRRCSQIKQESKIGVQKLQRHQYRPAQNELDRALIVASHYESATIIAMLLKWGAQVNALDKGGKSAAIHACIYGNCEALQVLIDSGADLSISDAYDKTALVYTYPGQVNLNLSEWGSIRVHETKQVTDPRTKCRLIIEKHLEQVKQESKCTCLIL